MPSLNVLFISALTFITTQARSVEDAKHGCTAPNALPHLPFFVVWNIPSGPCPGIESAMNSFDIVYNKKVSFIGEKMTLFYGVGAWPYLSGKNATPVNGGLPQLGNLTHHLEAVNKTVQQYIPAPNFNGLAVIDFEGWRPELYMNFDSLSVYITKSVELVKKQHPTWTDKKQINAEAARDFDTAARAYVLGTLERARQLRPRGYWGYYGYPRCWGDGPHYECSPSTAERNDKYLWWLFSTSTGFFPRIYTYRSQTLKSRYQYVREQVNETLRVQAKWSRLNIPIMPYSMEQDNGTDFFQKEDLEIAVGLPADLGASGVVIWGSSGYFHTRDECKKMVANIQNNFGPFVKNLTDFYKACAKDLCNNHGRCVRKDYEATTQEFLRLYEKKSCLRPREEYENLSKRRQNLFEEAVYRDMKKYDNSICRCYAGHYGEYCDKSL